MALSMAIIMNQNSYAGREYLTALKNSNVLVDVISIGSFPEIYESEEIRCGGLWKPTSMYELQKHFSIYHFSSLKDDALTQFLDAKKYDLGVQGGTGILKSNIIGRFQIGILNFHPGDLPSYRGCSAPEWQVLEKKAIISTCHLIDEGIDSGPIIAKKRLKCATDSYHAFRASIYPLTAVFMVEVVLSLVSSQVAEIKGEVQDESKAMYRNFIGDENIKKIIFDFNLLIQQIQ
jgi:methionyl-tRNA formyltransferase